VLVQLSKTVGPVNKHLWYVAQAELISSSYKLRMSGLEGPASAHLSVFSEIH
jgi:hypothetical protein